MSHQSENRPRTPKEQQDSLAKLSLGLLCFVLVFTGFLFARHAKQRDALARSSFAVQDIRVELPGQIMRGKLVAPNRATFPQINALVGLGQQDCIVRHRINDLYRFVRWVD